MNIRAILEYIKPEAVKNLETIDSIEVTGVSYNSKTIQKGDIFVCLVGEHVDGHDYALKAQDQGASAVVANKFIDGIKVPLFIVDDTQKELAKIAALIYNFPSKKLRMIGVTGTNGKTTVTHLIQNIIEANNNDCGLIGTLGNRLSSKDTYKDAKHTTPQSPELQQTLDNMVKMGINYITMEVSSHALVQGRVAECEFAGAVLTNLTQDHLDYHITMDNYFKAKSILFSSLTPETGNNKYAIINNDDPSADRFKSVVSEGIRVLTYGIENKSDIIAKNISFTVNGSEFDCITPVGECKINLQMTGMFSIYNALAALSAGVAEGIHLETCKRALESTKSVAGRFEVVTREPLAIVDYAHTPDGLSNVLNSARQIVPEGGRLICVFGCGGDRDATKRPKMGKIADTLSDIVIITSDNPRSEDPQQIITDILTGIKSLNSDRILVEIDRRSAIVLALSTANKNDVVMVAGKGHEDYQILKDKTIHFDDREEVLKAFEELSIKS